MDPDDPIQSVDEAPNYPDTVAGTLTRQRDELLRSAESDRGLALVYEQRAVETGTRAAQLQAAIDAMPPDPS